MIIARMLYLQQILTSRIRRTYLCKVERDRGRKTFQPLLFNPSIEIPYVIEKY